jgi:hypothetical protein
MTTDRKLKIIFGILSIGLLTAILFKLNNIPGGLILSGLFLGIMMIVAILFGCLIISGLLKLVFKRISFLTLIFISTTFAFIAFHYQLYSPTLTIKVPNNYKGEVNLVLSNVKDNILITDKNGIGYITEWTFNKTYSRPIVEQMDGKNLGRNLVGYNPSTFFGKGKSCCVEGNQIENLSFEIVPDDKIGEKQYYSKNFRDFINKKLVVLSKPNGRKFIDSAKVGK